MVDQLAELKKLTIVERVMGSIIVLMIIFLFIGGSAPEIEKAVLNLTGSSLPLVSLFSINGPIFIVFMVFVLISLITLITIGTKITGKLKI